jgi:hypothetical protein
MMEEWRHHIRDTHMDHEGMSLCGRDVRNEWAFTGIDHAFQTLRNESRLAPCKACARVVRDQFAAKWLA